ncbi:prepilin-type N-terminal cleavage/methylation domain-containing protein [Schnuerera sp.]|uniref:PulJ/GspJ family protein n=1 Tax=Schnuerera sp. TaxID=2794844 RepID=UPI002CA58B3B|nr:prepilin-type N-terminal cleavage/methylation domain-containing protein [Schnuerera sp.]HSH35571.1 prepilin-type N-terminal cleavage/methylation domain-containing protein [Schnuerera sp.]
MNRKLLDNRGLTLVELILTVTILGIIVSFMFIFLNFNYSTFHRSNITYNKETNLNRIIMAIEDELRFADQVYLYKDKHDNDFDTDKNYIYIKDNAIKVHKFKSESKILTGADIIINEAESYFQLEDNLITININGIYIADDEKFNIKSTIELLNIKGNDSEGSIIEYINIKGDDDN